MPCIAISLMSALTRSLSEGRLTVLSDKFCPAATEGRLTVLSDLISSAQADRWSAAPFSKRSQLQKSSLTFWLKRCASLNTAASTCRTGVTRVSVISWCFTSSFPERSTLVSWISAFARSMRMFLRLSFRSSSLCACCMYLQILQHSQPLQRLCYASCFIFMSYVSLAVCHFYMQHIHVSYHIISVCSTVRLSCAMMPRWPHTLSRATACTITRRAAPAPADLN